MPYTTPKYRITVPSPTTRLDKLGPELQQLGTSLEAALSRFDYDGKDPNLVLSRVAALEVSTAALNAKFAAAGAKVLATSTGVYLTASHTITLSEPIQDLPTGIILVWSEYLNGAATNASWNYSHIPKYARPVSGGIALPLTHYDGSIIRKYVYVSTDGKTVTGHAQNAVSPSNKLVLRAVIAY